MTWWQTVSLVAQREFAARKRATMIITLILVLVGVGVVMLAGVASGDGQAAALDPADADEVLGFIGVVVMFMAIVMTGQVLLMGVAEEKNSRVAEVVLGAMRPRLLLGGKVIAIGLIGLFEVLLTGTLVLWAGSAVDKVQLPDATGGAIAIVVLWFLLGFGFYATIYAAAGSLVARHQNAANAAGPINLMVMAGYFIGVVSSSAGANPVLKVASLTPPLAPTTMPLRMIQGTADVWEIVVSISLLVVTSYLMILLAERVYSGGLLSSGKTRFKDALRNAVR
ncbi:MAG: ABC transporter permease [Actinobacteria bacterium]|nr:ABC transporter permease [Actinomycetota bacterium]